MGDHVQETLDLFKLPASTHLYYEAASLHRGHIVINGTFDSPHALPDTFASDGLERGWHSPYGKHVPGVHRAVDCQAHHFKMAPVEITTSQCLKMNRKIRTHGDLEIFYRVYYLPLFIVTGFNDILENKHISSYGKLRIES